MKKIDHYITKLINQIILKYRLLSIFFGLITHTSSGKILPIYALLIPVTFPDGVSILKFGLIGFGFQVPLYFLLKNLIKRERPSAKNQINQIIKPPDKYSFPSGHCASSTLLFCSFSYFNPSTTIYFLIWVIIIFISRIGLGIHYFSDSIFGIFLGVISFIFAFFLNDIFLIT